MGYGTQTGGKMIDSLFKDTEYEYGSSYYLSYYDENYNKITGISKIDEQNLKRLSSDIGIDYIKMDNTSNIQKKVKEIQSIMKNTKGNEQKVNMYQDIYYYFAIILAIVLIIEFIIKRRRI